MPQVKMREATSGDISGTADMMARAFADKHPFVWIEPEEERRRRIMPALFVSLLRDLHQAGQVTELALVGGAPAGCAVWLAPSARKASFLGQARAAWRMFRAVGLGGLRSYGTRGKLIEEALGKVRPAEPHWYLVSLAVDPDHQGAGIGSALLDSGLRRCDREAMPAYLECLEDLMPYYESQGFVLRRWIDMPEGTPRQAGMIRSPGSPSS